MELINYLNEYFYTEESLLKHSQINQQQLLDWQNEGMMPAPSYRLKLDCSCDSFFGRYEQQNEVRYYAKGYTSWLGLLTRIHSVDGAYDIFTTRYRQSIAALNQRGYQCNDAKLNSGLESHITSEWAYFLDGTYGLCTQSGLPEDIAAKELAIGIINEITAEAEVNNVLLVQLEQAVNLLDRSSALFAPHERKNSSRQRLVNEVRRKYRLTTPI